MLKYSDAIPAGKFLACPGGGQCLLLNLGIMAFGICHGSGGKNNRFPACIVKSL